MAVELGRYCRCDAQKLTIKPIEGGGHRVYLDEHEIKCIYHLELEMGADMINTLRLEMYVGPYDVEVNEVREATDEQPV